MPRELYILDPYHSLLRTKTCIPVLPDRYTKQQWLTLAEKNYKYGHMALVSSQDGSYKSSWL